MEKSFLDRRLILAILVLFGFVFAIQMSEPAAAAKAKLFDKGSKKFFDSYSSTYYTFKWRSYKKTNYVLVKYRTTFYNAKYVGTKVLKKINRNKLRIVDTCNGKKYVYNKWTKLTPYQYYKKHFNKGGKHGFVSVYN